MENDSLLGNAILGLLRQQPMSGYDLRKVFATTAMGSFSDSPGAIYPALHRLEKRELVSGTDEESSSLRRRRVFSVTTAGLKALTGWLERPVTRDDIIRRMNDLMLRFAFMDGALGMERTVRFLNEIAAEIAAYLPELKQYLATHAEEMPLSGRLALEFGIEGYEAQLRWAKLSIVLYLEEERKRK